MSDAAPKDDMPWPAVAAMIVLVALVLSRVLWSTPADVLWTDRDLYRASRVLLDWPTSGAEMNHGSGARVPGGAYLWFLAAVHGLGLDGVGIYRLLLAIEGAAVVALTLGLQRLWGWGPALLGALWVVVPTEARDATVWMWNPSFVVPCVAVATAALLRAVTSEDGRGLWGWSLVVGFGASAHLTVAGWALGGGLGLLLADPTWTRKAWRPLLLGVGIWYVPFVVAEAVGRGGQSALLSEQAAPSASWTSRFAWQPDAWRDLGDWVVPVTGLPGILVLGVVLGSVCLGLVRREADAPRRRVLGSVLGSLCVILGPLLIDPHLQMERRYMLAALVGVGVMGTAAAGMRQSARWGRVLVWLAVGWLTVVAVQDVRRLASNKPRNGGPDAHHHLSLAGFEPSVREAAQAVDVPWWELPGRLLVVDVPEAGVPAVRQMRSLHHALWHEGRALQGSAAPPCFVLAPRALVAEELDAILGGTGANVSVLEARATALGPVVTSYRTDGSRCPTNLSNRYVDTPVEASMRRVWDDLGHEVATPLDAGALWAFRWRTKDRRGDVTLGLERLEGGRAVRLHSNQLRGHAYNGGWLEDAAVRDLTVVWSSEGTVAGSSMVRGTLGQDFVITPVVLDAPALEPGAYTVEVTGDVALWNHQGNIEGWATFSTRLASAWPVDAPPDR